MLYKLLTNSTQQKPTGPEYTSIGSSTLLHGDDTVGFFGEVPGTEFEAVYAIGSKIGWAISGQPAKPNWLKFVLDGKELFVPKTPLREAGWVSIYNEGCVYGDDTEGIPPEWYDPKIQNTKVTIQGHVFRVRLLRGANTLSGTIPDGKTFESEWGFDKPPTRGSELSRLFYPLISNASNASYVGPRWNLYTNAQLGFITYTTVCMERDPDDIYMGLLRGINGAEYHLSSYYEGGDNQDVWRPVLELVS